MVMFKLSEKRLEKEERMSEVCGKIIGKVLKKLEEEWRGVKEKIRMLKERIKEYNVKDRG